MMKKELQEIYEKEISSKVINFQDVLTDYINSRQIEEKREEIRRKINKIRCDIKNNYYKLKAEGLEYIRISRKLNLNVRNESIDDTDVFYKMNLIMDNFEQLKKHITETKNQNELDKIKDFVREIEECLGENDVKSEYLEELKIEFEKSFFNKSQELIKEAKINKLNIQKEILEKKRYFIWGKLIGKEQLKKVKIRNINLKKELINCENEETKDLTDSIIDLYIYVSKDESATEINSFLTCVFSCKEIAFKIDKENIKKMVDDKINKASNNMALCTLDKNKKLGIRKQINLVIIENKYLEEILSQNINNAEEVKEIVSFKKFKNLLEKIALLNKKNQEIKIEN